MCDLRGWSPTVVSSYSYQTDYCCRIDDIPPSRYLEILCLLQNFENATHE